MRPKKTGWSSLTYTSTTRLGQRIHGSAGCRRRDCRSRARHAVCVTFEESVLLDIEARCLGRRPAGSVPPAGSGLRRSRPGRRRSAPARRSIQLKPRSITSAAIPSRTTMAAAPMTRIWPRGAGVMVFTSGAGGFRKRSREARSSQESTGSRRAAAATRSTRTQSPGSRCSRTRRRDCLPCRRSQSVTGGGQLRQAGVGGGINSPDGARGPDVLYAVRLERGGVMISCCRQRVAIEIARPARGKVQRVLVETEPGALATVRLHAGHDVSALPVGGPRKARVRRSWSHLLEPASVRL